MPEITGIVIIRIRKGLSGFPFSVCTDDGHFISNAETIDEIRERYKYELKAKRLKLVKELSLFPEGRTPHYTVFGYARVSTKAQERDGNSLDAQEAELKAAGAQKIYREAYTGTLKDRPELDKLLKELRGGDTLVITKLDRIARSISQGEELINELLERRVKVHILNMGGILDNSPSAKLMRQMFFAFAEFERDMIVSRTQEGKAIAKTKPGYKEGRPKTDQKRLDHAMELLKDHSYKQVSDMTGISISTLTREKRRVRIEK